MISLPNMGLVKWDEIGDSFSHEQLASNFQRLDDHDHTAGKGVQIPYGGLANLSVGAEHLRDAAYTSISERLAVRPAFKARNAATLEPESTVTTVVPGYATVVFNSATEYLQVETSKLKAKKAGVYHFGTQVQWEPKNDGKRRLLQIRKNGTEALSTTSVHEPSSNSGGAFLTTSSLILMAVNDYVEAVVVNSGEKVAIANNAGSQVLWATFIG